MGWGTCFTTNLYLSKKIFRSINEIEEEIQNLIDEIQNDKESLLIIGASSFTAISKDDEDFTLNLKNSINELVSNIGANNVELYKLNLYLEAVKAGKADLTTNLNQI